MKTFFFIAATLCMTASFSSSANEHPWHINGFGSLGITHHTQDELGYRRNLEQARYARSGRLNTNTDSNFGLQIGYDAHPKLYFMAQSVVRLDSKGRWAPMVPFAFAKYQFDNSHELRLGRLSLDIYTGGDSRHVGYAYTSIRPSPDIYGQIMYDHFDGFDYVIPLSINDFIFKTKVYAGRVRGDYFIQDRTFAAGKGYAYGATFDWSSADVSMRFAVGQIHRKNANDYENTANELRALGRLPFPGLSAATGYADELERNSKISFLGIGGKWDKGPYSHTFIATKFNYSTFPSNDGWAAMLESSYRIGQFKPYVGFSYINIKPKDKPLSFPSGPGLPDLSQAETTYTLATRYLATDKKTLTLGLRYDVTPSAALKFQFDRIEANKSALLKDFDTPLLRNKNLNLYSLSLDYIF